MSGGSNAYAYLFGSADMGCRRRVGQCVEVQMKRIHKSSQTKLAFLICIIVAGLGVYSLISSHATTPYASQEAEYGSLTGAASVISDSAASGEEAVRFGNSCSTPFIVSVFCKPITNATVDDGSNGYPDSATLVADFNHEITETGYNVGINDNSYGIPIYRVSADQPLVPVTADCTATSDYTKTLDVPVPDGAVGATGNDSGVIFYQASTGDDWEFWHFKALSDTSFEACDGGELPNVSTSTGVFSLSGSQEASSGISYLATLITETDVQAGAINHALAVDLLYCKDYIPPARSNYDCGDGAIPYGQYFRFPSSVAMPSGLTPLGQMIFKAIQNYGVVTTDAGGAIQIGAEAPGGWYATTDTPTTTADPITAAMEGVPQYNVIAKLPWSELQAVQEP
jgi:hypothetical protein